MLQADKTSRQIIVFCKSIDSCRAVDHHLNAKGFDVVSLHGDIPPRKRTEMFDRFFNQQARILVCTDLASRGLDTICVCLSLRFSLSLSFSIITTIKRKQRKDDDQSVDAKGGPRRYV